MRTVILAIAISLTFPIASFGTVLWSTDFESFEVGSSVRLDEFNGHAVYDGENLDDMDLMCVERQANDKCLMIDTIRAIWFAPLPVDGANLGGYITPTRGQAVVATADVKFTSCDEVFRYENITMPYVLMPAKKKSFHSARLIYVAPGAIFQLDDKLTLSFVETESEFESEGQTNWVLQAGVENEFGVVEARTFPLCAADSDEILPLTKEDFVNVRVSAVNDGSANGLGMELYLNGIKAAGAGVSIFRPFPASTNKTGLAGMSFKGTAHIDNIMFEEEVVVNAPPAPVFIPASGTVFDEMQAVTIECEDKDAVIYYTIDGSEPTVESTLYRRFRIFGKTTVKAASLKNGIWSEVAVANYALGTCATPVIVPDDGSVFTHSSQTVSIAWNESDGVLRYTLDGSDPTEESAEYTGEFTISNTTTVKAKVFSDKYFDSDVVSATLVREWLQVATPVISAAAEFTGEKSRVTVSCATDGATIRYTIDGSEPSTDSEMYEGVFYVTNSCTIKAIAMMDDFLDSAVASAVVTKVWCVGDSLGVPSVTFANGGDASWVRDTEVGMNSGESMRSGAVSSNQTSVLTATVKGKGVFSFWWKSSCEDSGGYYDWDHAEFQADCETHYIDGETDWTKITHEFTTSGEHELRWTYIKDFAEKDGRDCVWIAAAQWNRDPMPEVGENPTAEEIEDALYGSRDMRLVRRIVDASGYAAYRNWADKVCGQDFASRQVLKDSPNAWLAFVLDAAVLVGKAELTSEDVTIESIEPSGVEADAFDLFVGVGGAEIGEGARLAEALGVEGADELDEAAFSSENLTTTFQRTTDGKAKATIVPIGAPPKFFLRVKVK